MALAGFIVAVMALAVSLVTAQRQLRLARNANAVPVLIDLFREHRSKPLADARKFVHTELEQYDLSLGLQALPDDQTRESLRDLMWYYDNLGIMVAQRFVVLQPVAGYLGTSVTDMWRALEPLVRAERAQRTITTDPGRWQWSFEYLAAEVQHLPPNKLRPSLPSRKGRS